MALTPPDPACCQAEKGGAFMLGPGLMRCSAKPTVIATEKKPGADGVRGSMSLCTECQGVLVERMGDDYANFEAC